LSFGAATPEVRTQNQLLDKTDVCVINDGSSAEMDHFVV